MISDWRGDRRIIGPSSPFEDSWRSALLALQVTGWAVAAATASVFVRLAFGEVATVAHGVYLWAWVFLATGLIVAVCMLLLKRLWASALIASALTAVIAFAVWRWALPLLAAFGWTDTPVVP